MPPLRIARHDPSLSARVVSRAPLRFADGADPLADRPAHVRAGSGLARIGERLAVILDDANFVALVDPATPDRAHAIALPAGPDGRRQFGDSRGSKHLKLDLEACVATPGPEPRLVAFGSGSSPARESAAIVSFAPAGEPRVALAHVPALYARLREAAAFAGSELNVEGAVLAGDALRLFGRGNGAVRGDARPVNASCDLPWDAVLAHLLQPTVHAAPEPMRIEQFDLGALHGVPLGFTDAARWDEAVLFTAAAEASPDTRRDGDVLGSVVGIIEPGGAVRWAPIIDAAGAPLVEKAEGLALADEATGELWVVVDADDEDRPSALCRVALGGAWRR